MRPGAPTTLCDRLPELYSTGQYSDVQLQFFDNSIGAPGRCARLTIDTHKFILRLGSVPVLARLLDTEHYADLRDNQTIRIELNFAHFANPAVLRFFFGLIYHNKLASAVQKSVELAHFIDENVLQLHQLACYFGYAALQDLCLRRLYRLFSLDTASHISEYCVLQQQQQHRQSYYVPQEKHALFTKLMHWYQLCCVDAHVDARSAVEHFDRHYRLPDAGITFPSAATTRLTHYRRVCTDCVKNPRLVTHGRENGVINMGTVGGGGSDRWSFSMAHRLGNNTNMTLFLKHRMAGDGGGSSSSDDDQMSVDECTRVRCQVRLFSQARDDTTCCTELVVASAHQLTELTRQLVLHAEQDCYEGLCDCCQRDDESPIYVFCISVDIIK